MAQAGSVCITRSSEKRYGMYAMSSQTIDVGVSK